MGKDSAKAERYLQHLEPLQGALETYCRHSLQDPNLVEDVLQSVVANTFRDFHRYVEGTNFRAWIFRYLNLEIYARNRRYQRSRHQSLLEEPPIEETWELAVNEPLLEILLEAPDAVLDRCDQSLADAVNQLSSLERSVLLLRAVGDFKYREIAEVLDVPIGSVMSALSRGRQHLRLRLVEYGRDHGLLKQDDPLECGDSSPP